MSETSPRMLWPFPSEDDNPWFPTFQSMIAAMDASCFASREDRNLLMMGGGTITWDGSVLAWSAPIEILSPNTGLLNQIPAGNVTLADGQVARGNVSRALGANASMAVAAAGFAASTDNSIVVCIRRGTSLYWRNGLLMLAGDSVLNVGSAQGVAASTSVFVFRPGGVEELNVYTTWATLYAEASLAQGPVTVQIDTSLGAASVTAGVYDLQDWTLFGSMGKDALRPYLYFLDGVTITGSFRMEKLIAVLDIGALTSPIQPNASNGTTYEAIDTDLDGGASGIGLINVNDGEGFQGSRLVLRGTSSVYGGAVYMGPNTDGNLTLELYDQAWVLASAIMSIGGYVGALMVSCIDNETVSFAAQGDFWGVTVIRTPHVERNGPLDATQVGVAELHVGSIYLEAGPRILAASAAMLGVSGAGNPGGNLQLKKFSDATIMATWFTVSALGEVLLGADVSIIEAGWYDFYLFGMQVGDTVVVKGLRLLTLKE